MMPDFKNNLRESIDKAFSLSELQQLVFDLDIDWDHLAGEEKPSKIISLIKYMENRGRRNELVEVCEKKRPNKSCEKPSSDSLKKIKPTNNEENLLREYHSCFISFSSRDQAFADQLNNDLKAHGVQTWFAPHDLKIGARIRQTFDENVLKKHKLLLILSEYSVNSDWVEQEVETALAKERREKLTMLFPVRVDDAVFDKTTGWPAFITNTRNIGNFCHTLNKYQYQNAFRRLLKDLQV